MPYPAPLQLAIPSPTVGVDLLQRGLRTGRLVRYWIGRQRFTTNLVFGYVFGYRRGEYVRSRPIWRGVIAVS